MYAAKTAAAAAANFHHSPTSTDGSSQGLCIFYHSWMFKMTAILCCSILSYLSGIGHAVIQ